MKHLTSIVTVFSLVFVCVFVCDEDDDDVGTKQILRKKNHFWWCLTTHVHVSVWHHLVYPLPMNYISHIYQHWFSITTSHSSNVDTWNQDYRLMHAIKSNNNLESSCVLRSCGELRTLCGGCGGFAVTVFPKSRSLYTIQMFKSVKLSRVDESHPFYISFKGLIRLFPAKKNYLLNFFRS